MQFLLGLDAKAHRNALAVSVPQTTGVGAVEEAGAAARGWLGEGAVVKPSRTSSVFQSQDGLRQLRLDLQGHGPFPPHGHLEVWDPAFGRFVDAPGVPHHLYFSDVPKT